MMKNSGKIGRPPANPAVAAFAATRFDWFHVAIFSVLVNLLMLTGSIYMLQVYDRVLASSSVATLLGLSAMAVLAFGLQGILDAIRLRMLGRIGARVDQSLSALTARAAVLLPIRGARPELALQPARDLDNVRSFLSGTGPTALIDIPFTPIFLIGCYILHPLLFALAFFGALLSVGLTVLNAWRTSGAIKKLQQLGQERNTLIEAGRRNSEVISALGMSEVYGNRYGVVHTAFSGLNLKLADVSGTYGVIARQWRYILQSAVLGLGAYLVIRAEMSPGAMIAASILTSRALAPVDAAVANWKSFAAARAGFDGLRKLLPLVQDHAKRVALPSPSRSIRMRGVGVGAPGTDRLIVEGVSLDLKAGTSLALIGPSGSGKSTLARALVGAWPTARGEIRLDGALMSQWEPAALGASIGYLPQDVELFDGSIADNIARFDPEMTSEAVIEAARVAGAHEMILALPAGYETVIGEGGAALSGGQRQRVALARALYRDPFLIVLDEPNSSLDASGDRALANAIRSTCDRGGIVVVVTHRPSGLREVELVGVMTGGKLEMIGPRDEVLGRAVRNAPSIAPATSEPANPPQPAVAAASPETNVFQSGPGRVDATPADRVYGAPFVAAVVNAGLASALGAVADHGDAARNPPEGRMAATGKRGVG